MPSLRLRPVTLPCSCRSAISPVEVTEAKRPEFLLDEKLKIIAASRPAATLTRAQAQPGHHPASATRISTYRLQRPSPGSMGRAIATHISPPEFEIFHRDKDGRTSNIPSQCIAIEPNRYARLLPACHHHRCIGDRRADTEDEQRRCGCSPQGVVSPPRNHRSPSCSKALVKRRAIRERKNVSYLTLRSWRQPIREYQIEAAEGP